MRFLLLLVASAVSIQGIQSEPFRGRGARRLAKELKALSPDHAFYLAGKLAGVALIEGNMEKAKGIWLIYTSNFRRSDYAFAAAVQAALVTRIGAGGTQASDFIFSRVAVRPARTSLVKSCREIARRWLARSRIKKLHQALERYWWKNLEYPSSLDLLVKSGEAAPGELRTPWGTYFRYKLTRSDILPKSKGQAYELYAVEVGKSDGDPNAILQEWVARLPVYVLWGIASAQDGTRKAMIGRIEKGSLAGNKTFVRLGGTLDDMKLVHVDTVGAVLAAKDYLLVLPQRIMAKE